MIVFIIWIALSIILVIISRHSLLHPLSHGFYRFFSWECILWLMLNNYIYWFVNPFSLKQVFSWIFLFSSLFFIFPSIKLFKKTDRHKAARQDKTLYNFEKTTGLIKTGIFKYIRHPMYSSLLFLTWGISLKNPGMSIIIISILSSIFLYATAKCEEREDVLYFGNIYKEYMKQSKMFIPFLF